MSWDTLMPGLWDEHWVGSTKTLDVHVAALRRRLSAVADGAVVSKNHNIARTRAQTRRTALDMPAGGC